MKKFWLPGLLALIGFQLSAQKEAETFREIYSQALTEQQGYEWLRELCSMGPRFAGSDQATASVLHFKAKLDSMGFETRLQAVKVPHWVRGPQEQAWLIQGIDQIAMAVTALGGSIATPAGGLRGNVVEIPSFEALDSLDLKGKIPFDPMVLLLVYH